MDVGGHRSFPATVVGLGLGFQVAGLRVRPFMPSNLARLSCGWRSTPCRAFKKESCGQNPSLDADHFAHLAELGDTFQQK